MGGLVLTPNFLPSRPREAILLASPPPSSPGEGDPRRGGDAGEGEHIVQGLVRSLISDVDRLSTVRFYGKVDSVQGLLIEAVGLGKSLSLGDRCQVIGRDRRIICEAVGFRNGKALLMPFSSLDGVGLGARVEVVDSVPVLHPHPSWLGRVINAMGEPVDGKGPLLMGEAPYPIRNKPPPAHSRQRVAGKVDLGVRAMNTFLTLCRGQRMGIFAGSGRRQIDPDVDDGAATPRPTSR